MEENSILIH